METNAALLELCPGHLDQDVPGHPHQPARPRLAPLAPVPIFIVPIGEDGPSAPPPSPSPSLSYLPSSPSFAGSPSSSRGSGSALSPDSCLGLNGHSAATLDDASRRWLLAGLPARVSAAMAEATYWELCGTRGLLVVACGEDARQMGFSVESVRRGSPPPHTPYEVLTARELRAADRCPETERERMITRFWVRKDAAMQAAGGGLSIGPERIEAGFPADHGTVTVPGPYGCEVPVSVRNFTFSPSYEFAVATPEPLPLAPSFAYSVS
ncbi:hypothetical protein [Streptomyces sp. NPDC059649]|uniref:hypothetical protein n=1 Tax=Streptomyces sp. NPDC059649 TaxID=3346895 RepID=UPI0036818E40